MDQDPYRNHDGSPAAVAFYERMQVSTVNAIPGIEMPARNDTAAWETILRLEATRICPKEDFIWHRMTEHRYVPQWQVYRPGRRNRKVYRSFELSYDELILITYRTDLRDELVEAIRLCPVPLEELHLKFAIFGTRMISSVARNPCRIVRNYSILHS
jgi:hypothetical protein